MNHHIRRSPEKNNYSVCTVHVRERSLARRGLSFSGWKAIVRTRAVLVVLAVLVTAPIPVNGQSLQGLSAKDSARERNRIDNVVREYYSRIAWEDVRAVRRGCATSTINCFKGDHYCELVRGCSHPALGTELNAVIASLDEVAARLPGDNWVAGQRLAFRIKAGRLQEADSIAATCGATPWWCSVLRAWIRHLHGDEAADSMFLAALSEMPARHRCEWEDLNYWVPKELRPVGASTCESARQAAQDIWRLADPLLLRPGNDRRAEHYARYTEMLLFIGMARVIGRDRKTNDVLDPFSWMPPSMPVRTAPSLNCVAGCSGSMTWPRSDRAPLLLQFGWPQTYGLVNVPQSGEQIRFHHWQGYHFLPDRDGTHEPWSTVDADWGLKAGRGPSRGPLGSPIVPSFEHGSVWELYQPRYAEFEQLVHQTAVFRRGANILIVSKPDIAAARASRGLALFTNVGESETPIRHEQLRTDSRGRPIFMATASARPQLLALEAWAANVAHRTRFGTGSLDNVRDNSGISDIMLLDGAPPDQVSLEEVLDAMLSTTTVSGTSIGLYWEAHGLAQGARGRVTVRVTNPRSESSLALPNLFGQGDRPSEVTWEFVATPDSSGVQPFAFVVPVQELPPGDYEVSVTCHCTNRDSVSSRSFAIRR